MSDYYRVTTGLGHELNSDVMLIALKKIYVDLGYASVSAPASDLSGGTWTDFDQTEFV